MTAKTPISMGPRTFRVLTTESLKDEDKAIIRTQFAKFTSAWDAYVNHLERGFAKVSISPSGRAYSLQFKGVEVALLVRRHSYIVELRGVETAPAVVLKSEEDEWVLIDLLNARDALTDHSLTKLLSTAQTEVQQLRATLAQRETILQLKGDLVNTLENKVQDYKDRDAKRAKRAAAAAVPKPPVKPVKPATKRAAKVATKRAATVKPATKKPVSRRTR